MIISNITHLSVFISFSSKGNFHSQSLIQTKTGHVIVEVGSTRLTRVSGSGRQKRVIYIEPRSDGKVENTVTEISWTFMLPLLK